MRIAILGSGNMGAGMAHSLSAAGADVILGVRDVTKARNTVAAAVPIAEIPEAVAGADMLVLALPYLASIDLLQTLPGLQGKVLVDISNPVTADFQGLQLGTTTSAAEAIQAAAPGAHVVKAFNTIFAPLLAADARSGQALQVLVAGDDAGAKDTVQQLARTLGFEPIDAGPLRNSRFLEPVGAMNIHFGFFLGWGPTTAPSWVRV